ncbi:MAG: hypothetical protein ACFE9L_16610 [Candidatus Hodarchaeota archaeon]
MENNLSTFLVDGNNVVFNKQKEAKLERLINLKNELITIGKCYTVVSHELRFRIDDRNNLKKLISSNDVIQTPKKVDCDLYILEIARKLNAYLVSNDNFRQYKSYYPDVLCKRLHFLFVSTHDGNIPILPWKKDFEGS